MPAKRLKKYDSIIEMYDSGLSIEAIARFFGKSRQSMHAALKRRCCVFRDNRRFGKDNRFYRDSRADGYAQNALEYAIRKGIIQRKTRCESCGEGGVFRDGRTSIQAHHADYNKPLSVMWLCQKCHHEWHRTNKAVRRKGGGA